MFSSEPTPLAAGDVEEFHLPDLTAATEAPSQASGRFQPWEYGDPEPEEPLSPAAEPTAEDILAAARQKAQEIEQQAYEEGFRQGQEDGQEVGRRALQEVIHRLQGLVTALEQEREDLFRQREKLLVDLVLAISEKIVGQELSLHPEALRALIQEGFRHISHQEGVRLVVSPLDYDFLSQEQPESWPMGVELRADPSITPGGFRLETALGEVDGTRETRWALINQAIREAVEGLYAADRPA